MKSHQIPALSGRVSMVVRREINWVCVCLRLSFPGFREADDVFTANMSSVPIFTVGQLEWWLGDLRVIRSWLFLMTFFWCWPLFFYIFESFFKVCFWVKYSIAWIIWPSLICTPWIIRTIIPDKTCHHWWPMLNCPFNSNPNFMQSCLIQTHTQITLHWHPMLNCPFNSNPNFA